MVPLAISVLLSYAWKSVYFQPLPVVLLSSIKMRIFMVTIWNFNGWILVSEFGLCTSGSLTPLCYKTMPTEYLLVIGSHAGMKLYCFSTGPFYELCHLFLFFISAFYKERELVFFPLGFAYITVAFFFFSAKFCKKLHSLCLNTCVLAKVSSLISGIDYAFVSILLCPLYKGYWWLRVKLPQLLFSHLTQTLNSLIGSIRAPYTKVLANSWFSQLSLGYWGCKWA